MSIYLKDDIEGKSMKRVVTSIILATMTISTNVLAQEGNTGFSLGGQVGIYGLGAHFKGKFSETLAVKVGFDQFQYNDIEIKDEQVKYNFDVSTKDILATLDWHPFAGSFATRVGVIINDSNLKGTIKPNVESQSFTFNGTPYSTDDIAKVHTSVDFEPVAPYVGIGWDTSFAKESGFGFTFDLGVMHQGAATVDYTVDYTSELAKTLISEELEKNLKEEKISLQKELDKYEYQPFIAIGVNYKF